MNETLMRVLEEFAAFIDLHREEELNPAAAAWGRQRLRTLVGELSASEQRELRAFLERQRDASEGDYRIWIEGLPDRLGLAQGT